MTRPSLRPSVGFKLGNRAIMSLREVCPDFSITNYRNVSGSQNKMWVKVTKNGFMGRAFITFIFFFGIRNAMKHDGEKNAIYHVDFGING